jgi:hypothetical protein
MTPLDANTTPFLEIIFDGKPALHSEMRIDRKTIPKGLYAYEVRHADDDFTEPIQVCRHVMVNFYGTLITTKPLHIPPDGIGLEHGFDFKNAEVTDMFEFTARHHIKPKEIEHER